MIIESKDAKAFLRQARHQYEIGADTVFCENRLVKPEDLRFCIGVHDEALFRHETYNYDQYNSYNVRTLYEALTLIDKSKVPVGEYLFAESEPGRELIDLGKFIQKKELITQLHQSMKHGDWYYEYSDDFQVWRKGEAFFNRVKENLLWLSHQENGKSLANELWTMYAPPHSLRRPDFLKEPTHDTTQRQPPSNDHNQVSQEKQAHHRRQQTKKIKRTGQHRRRM